MKYRKKPVVIEAFQMTKERRLDNHEWPNWLNYAWNLDFSVVGAVGSEGEPPWAAESKLIIRSLEGVMTVDWGDWIIRGVKGELYPCKPDIFAATYDPVSPAAESGDVDAIVSALYRRFKDWSKRGFGPDDVTWCEVRADVLALTCLPPASAEPDAFVPMHPKHGPLWACTTENPTSENTPEHYPLAPVYLAPPVPAGLKLTDQMVNAAYKALCYGNGPSLHDDFPAALRRMWEAMLAASPETHAAPPVAAGWQPIESAPTGVRFLACVPIENHRLVIAYKNDLGLILDERLSPMHYPPLWWHPLPPAPEQQA